MQQSRQQDVRAHEWSRDENKILLLGDSRTVIDLIAAGLAPRNYEARMLTPSARAHAPLDAGCCLFKLIILALSHDRCEPPALWAETELPFSTGRIPMLIISEAPFRADFAHNILHLPFPLRANTLQPIVDYLLCIPLYKN